MEIQILELKKLPQEVKNGEDIMNWMQFFSGKGRKDFENMAKKNEYLDEAYNTLLTLSADEEKRLEYEDREKALKDHNSQISSAEKRGEERGEERVRKVFWLEREGKSPEEISALCGLPIEKVNYILGIE